MTNDFKKGYMTGFLQKGVCVLTQEKTTFLTALKFNSNPKTSINVLRVLSFTKTGVA